MMTLFLTLAALGFGIYCAAGLYGGLRSGGVRVFARGLPYFRRTREPRWFWFGVAFNGFLAIASFFVGIVAAGRWLEPR